MSARGDVELVWGDGRHRFRLAIGQLQELEEKTGHGPFELFEKMLARKWRVADIRHVIRIGLIGGGKSPAEAVALVDRHIDDWPWVENVSIALHVLNEALSGNPEDQPGKEGAGEAGSGGASPALSETEPRSGSRRRKSTT